MQQQLTFIEEQQQFPPEDLPLVAARCRLPQLTDAGWFNRYYEAYRRAFFAYCRRVIAPRAQALYAQALAQGGGLVTWEITLDTTVTLNEPPLLSLYTDTVERIDGHRTVLRRSDTWHLSAGEPVALSSLFAPGSHWRRLMLETATRQIRAGIADGTCLYHPDWRRRIRSDFSSERFYLTPEALCFYYQMYAIAPAAEGVPVFRIPYDTQHGVHIPT